MNEQVLLEARKMIAGFIRNRRIELKMSQEELAERTQLGIATIKRFEAGKFWINLKTLLVGNYKMTAKISGNNQVIIIDSKNRFAGWIDADNKKVVAKYQGSKVLLGSLVRNALVQALNYNY